MITASQLADRAKGFGSSDCAALLGLSRWKTAADVIAEKRGLLPPEPEEKPWEGSKRLAWMGTHSEVAIAAMFAEREGLRVVKPTGAFVHEDYPCLRANPDRMVESAARGQPVVECKETGLSEDLGEDGSDDIPDEWMAQVCHQLVCCDSTICFVPTKIVGLNRDFRVFKIDRADKDVQRICLHIERVLPEMWQKHVVEGVPYDGPLSDENLKRVVRKEGKSAPVRKDLYTSARSAKAIYDAADEAWATARRALVTSMGDATEGTIDGRVAVTYRRTKDSWVFDKDAFVKSQPVIAAQYQALRHGHHRLLLK